MADQATTPTATLTKMQQDYNKRRPTFETDDAGVVQVHMPEDDTLTRLMNTQTHQAASGLMGTALNALGRSGEQYRDMLAAMLVELKPRDPVEAMLITQMTATHVAMTSLTQKAVDTQSGYQVREALERSMTRLSRTYIAQMDALKKYRAKAQQTVRVERVNVESGGQAIVGDVRAGGRGEDEK